MAALTLSLPLSLLPSGILRAGTLLLKYVSKRARFLTAPRRELIRCSAWARRACPSKRSSASVAH
eukprot:8681075-Alexandrium_andersonii.AAC.1